MNTQRKLVTTPEAFHSLSVVNSPRAKKCNENTLPVIKVTFTGDILYANLASLPLMGEWGVSANQKLPDWFLHQFAGIFHPHACHELKIPFTNYAVFFTSVPFVEAGYIGLYAYQLEELNRINQIK